MKRPDWWPHGWKWPGDAASGPEVRPVAPAAAVGSATAGAEDLLGSFLRVLTVSFGAEHAVLYRLDRERDRWTPERSAPAEAAGPGALRVRGHPITWCARERLVVQIPTADLPDPPAGVSWLLAGGLRGGEKVLVLAFAGAPPGAARRAMGAAVEHLWSLSLAEESGGRTN